MEQINLAADIADMYCLGCLCSGYEYKIQEYKMRYYPHFKAVLEVASLKLCYLCRKMAQHAELFMKNVHSNQVILENCLEDFTLAMSTKPESQGPPPIALSFSPTHTDSLREKDGHTNNTRKGCFTQITANTAGILHTVLPNSLSRVKKEVMLKPIPHVVVSPDEPASVSDIDVKQELDTVRMEHESNDDFDYDMPIKQEKFHSSKLVKEEDLPLARSVKREKIRKIESSPKKKNVKKSSKTKTGKKKMTMKEKLEAAKKKNDDDGIDMVHITLEQCMEERRLKALDPAYQARPYKCADCVKGFAHKPSYDQHLQRHSAACGDFACSVCAVRLVSDRKLAAHERLHTVRYRCRQCGMSRGDRPTVMDHVLSRHRADATHACPHCHKRFKRHSSFKKHVAYTHERTDRVICDLCNNSFARKEVLRMHMVYQHPAAVGAPAGGPPRAHRCPLCPAAFKQRTTLRAHARTHSDYKPHYCVECDKRFKTEGALKFHLKTAQPHVDTTTTELPSCSFCQKRFINARSRDRHTDTVHLQHRPHKCDTCSKGFSCKSQLRKHVLKAHEGYKLPRTFLCHYCDQAFTTRQVLAAHIRRHTGERPFQCGECAATFAYSAALYTHRRLVHQRLPRKPNDKMQLTML